MNARERYNIATAHVQQFWPYPKPYGTTLRHGEIVVLPGPDNTATLDGVTIARWDGWNWQFDNAYWQEGSR